MFRLLLIIFFISFFVVFAISNTELQDVWMIGFGWKLPLGTSVLAVASISLFFGIILGWFGEFSQRRRARKAENQVKNFLKETEELKNNLLQKQSHIDSLSKQIEELENKALSSHPTIKEEI